ncbi:hypothetical protein BGZ83_005549 [Gryganskiella cystojenkinii]|nr:hypothetical protein BGZ83_005549 [Gryganskiella cystojenkinii]
MSGQIHFVTPTNRWIGSIPLSTLDPLTLEPLSTYVRPDPATEAPQEQQSEHENRRTNLACQPVSLILARLQTTPHGCSCGCTVPAPPKHSDYYHAQHLLQLIFQTQKVRSRALRTHIPQYFDQPEPRPPPSGEVLEEPVSLVLSPPSSQSPNQGQDQDQDLSSTAIPIEPSSTTTTAQPHSGQKPKVPRYVHSLIQNRSFKNPLTNTEVEGDPTFFTVLEPDCGGWWFEPWAMVSRPAGVTGIVDSRSHHHHHHQHHDRSQDKDSKSPEAVNASTITIERTSSQQHQQVAIEQKTPEMIFQEKERRKEKWRQERLVNLETEAQHELDWRRWQRTLIMTSPRSGSNTSSRLRARTPPPLPRSSSSSRRESTATRSSTAPSSSSASSSWKQQSHPRLMRYRLGKDIAVLEPSERGLRLPTRLKGHNTVKETSNRGHTNKADPSVPTSNARHSPVPASAAPDDAELADIRQHEAQLNAEKQPQDSVDDLVKDSQQLQSRQPKSARRERGALPQDLRTMPWWEPKPQPLKLPNTGLSPFAISTLPAPVAERFGGKSIYQRPPLPPLASSSSSSAASSKSGSSEPPNDDRGEKTTEAPAATTAAELECNTDGCKWVSVPAGDRVAVMIGTSKDFMLFPSFQRLMFRHLSREDFEDRAGRVGVIPYPALLVMATAPPRDSTRQSLEGSGNADRSELRDEYGRLHQVSTAVEEVRTRSWLPWRRNTASVTNPSGTATDAPLGRVEQGSVETTLPLSEPTSSHDPQAIHSKTGALTGSNADMGDIKLDTTAGAAALPGIPSVSHKPIPEKDLTTASRTNEKEDFERQLELYLETFEREDYDSSEYSFFSSSDEADDRFDLDLDAEYDFSSDDDEASRPSDDEDGRELGPGGREGRTRSHPRQPMVQNHELAAGDGDEPEERGYANNNVNNVSYNRSNKRCPC